MLERMSADEIVAYVEKLDNDYYRAIPSVNELAAMYGDRTNQRLTGCATFSGCGSCGNAGSMASRCTT